MSLDLQKNVNIRYNVGIYNIGNIINSYVTYKDYLKLNNLYPKKNEVEIEDIINYLNYLINIENLSDRLSENSIVSLFNILPKEKKEPGSLIFTEYLILPYLSEIIPYIPNSDSIRNYRKMAEYNIVSTESKYIGWWNYILLLLPFYDLDFILNHIDMVIDNNLEYKRVITHLHTLKELIIKSLREFINSSLKDNISFLSDKISFIEMVNDETISLKSTDSIYKLMMDFIDNNEDVFRDILEERNGVS